MGDNYKVTKRNIFVMKMETFTSTKLGWVHNAQTNHHLPNSQLVFNLMISSLPR